MAHGSLTQHKQVITAHGKSMVELKCSLCQTGFCEQYSGLSTYTCNSLCQIVCEFCELYTGLATLTCNSLCQIVYEFCTVEGPDNSVDTKVLIINFFFSHKIPANCEISNEINYYTVEMSVYCFIRSPSMSISSNLLIYHKIY